MKWVYWTGGICIAALLIYLNFKQRDLVVTWVKPEGDSISEKAEWVFGKYSSGKIAHVRECIESVGGWKALEALWPVCLALAIVSLTAGVVGGYFLRYKYYAAEYERRVSKLEDKYKHYVEIANKSWAMDAQSRRRMMEADEKEDSVKDREKKAAEKEKEIDKIVDEKAHAIKKQLQHLQEDYKNRGYKIENLEKDKIELKRTVIARDKEIIQLSEEILDVKREILELKREK